MSLGGLPALRGWATGGRPGHRWPPGRGRERQDRQGGAHGSSSSGSGSGASGRPRPDGRPGSPYAGREVAGGVVGPGRDRRMPVVMVAGGMVGRGRDRRMPVVTGAGGMVPSVPATGLPRVGRVRGGGPGAMRADPARALVPARPAVGGRNRAVRDTAVAVRGRVGRVQRRPGRVGPFGVPRWRLSPQRGCGRCGRSGRGRVAAPFGDRPVA